MIGDEKEIMGSITLNIPVRMFVREMEGGINWVKTAFIERDFVVTDASGKPCGKVGRNGTFMPFSAFFGVDLRLDPQYIFSPKHSENPPAK